jgi:hypothetical protein
MHDDVPQSTVRAMGAVLIAIFDIALDGTRAVVERLRPLVEPPEDMRVTGTSGVLYTGLVIIERGDVIAGIVIEVGRVSSAPPVARPPLVTPPAHFDPPGRFEERDGRLPGWADDPREDLFGEDGRWRRR